jgi:hypothetical protein
MAVSDCGFPTLVVVNIAGPRACPSSFKLASAIVNIACTRIWEHMVVEGAPRFLTSSNLKSHVQRMHVNSGWPYESVSLPSGRRGGPTAAVVSARGTPALFGAVAEPENEHWNQHWHDQKHDSRFSEAETRRLLLNETEQLINLDASRHQSCCH